MKKLLILLSFLSVLVSCISNSTAIDDDALINTPESLEIHALRLMEEFYGPATKGCFRIPTSYTISYKTKGGDSMIFTEIVNFEGNQGFVVMTTEQQKEDNLIAISNIGNINTTLLETAILSHESVIEDSNATTTIWGGEIIEEDEIIDDEDEPYYDIDPFYSSETFTPFITYDEPSYQASSITPDNGIVEQYIAEYVTENKYVTKDGDTNTGEMNSTMSPDWSPWEFYSGKKPMIKTKWSQSSPYNDKCPIIKGVHAPAGCAAIATGQIAAYFQKPTTENWSIISSFGVYNSSQNVYYRPYSSYDAISTFIYSLGKELNMDYGADGSGSSIYHAKSYARKQMGFDARIHNWDWERVKERLKKDIPVYTRGKGPKGVHAWIVDGYIIQRSRDQNNICSDRYRTLVHMNWGWSGTYDGYYLVGIFDPTAIPEAFDANCGDQGQSRTDGVKFTKKIKTLTWSVQ